MHIQLIFLQILIDFQMLNRQQRYLGEDFPDLLEGQQFDILLHSPAHIIGIVILQRTYTFIIDNHADDAQSG